MTTAWAPSPRASPSVNDQRGDAIEGGSVLFREGNWPQNADASDECECAGEHCIGSDDSVRRCCVGSDDSEPDDADERSEVD